MADRWGRGCSERDGLRRLLAAGSCSAPAGVWLRAVWVAATGGVETAVLSPTEPVVAVWGLISFGSSTVLSGVDGLVVVELSPRLVMWTSTEIQGWPNLCATRVAAAFGHCGDIVCGTAVFTGARDTQAKPTILSATLAARVRDLT